MATHTQDTQLLVQYQLENLKIIQHDAIEVMNEMIPESLNERNCRTLSCGRG